MHRPPQSADNTDFPPQLKWQLAIWSSFILSDNIFWRKQQVYLTTSSKWSRDIIVLSGQFVEISWVKHSALKFVLLIKQEGWLPIQNWRTCLRPVSTDPVSRCWNLIFKFNFASCNMSTHRAWSHLPCFIAKQQVLTLELLSIMVLWVQSLPQSLPGGLR